jgi:hypothetical protein
LPEKDIVPPVPARKVRDVAPSTVAEKLILAPAIEELVLLKVGAFARETGPVNPIVLPVVIFPWTLIAVDPV